MKLSKIGSLVIFLPFMFQLILAAVLFALLFQTQEQLLRTARSEKIVKQTNEICMEFMNGVLAFYEANENPVEVARSMTEFHAIERMDTQVQSVTQLLDQAGPRGVKSKEIIISVARKARFFLTGCLAAIRSGKVDFALHQMLDAGPFANGLVHELSQVDAGEKIYAIEQERAAMQRRDQIKTVLALAAVAGLLMTCVVATFCVVHIRRRINQISRNLKLFALRQPLEPELKSEDELAQLDVDVHSMDTAVREASERERTLIDNAADLICSIDGHGNFQRVNAFARRLLGVEPDNLVGQSLFDLVHRDDCAALDAALNEACAVQRGHTFEVRMQHHDKHYIETSWSSLWSQADKSLFCVVRDITERKKIERLKDDFLAMIKHDLRTPLMSLSLDISMLDRLQALPVSESVSLARCAITVNHLIALVNDLLDYEKLLAGKMEYAFAKVKIDTLLADCYCALNKTDGSGEEDSEEKQTSESLPLDLESMDPDCTIYGDREMLARVLTNLVSYALLHGKPEDRVKLSAKRSPTLDSQVVISVHDRNSENSAVSFEPFSDFDPLATDSGKATGLELAICKLLVEGHGGKIDVVQHEKKGRLFLITLPTV